MTAFHEMLSQLFPQVLGETERPVGVPGAQELATVRETELLEGDEPVEFVALTVYV